MVRSINHALMVRSGQQALEFIVKRSACHVCLHACVHVFVVCACVCGASVFVCVCVCQCADGTERSTGTRVVMRFKLYCV